MSSSIGKRQRERQKLERAQVKAERKAVRQAGSAESPDAAELPQRSESELIDDLRALQQAFGAGQLSADEFEERRGQIQAELERHSL